MYIKPVFNHSDIVIYFTKNQNIVIIIYNILSNQGDIMKQPLKQNVIIDCDPGVDDSAALILAFLEPSIDIQLITTVSGNRTLEICTRNTLHLLERFNLDIPVVMGAAKPLNRERKDATHIHGVEGLGKYIPPEKPRYKKAITDVSAEDSMYKIIKENPNEIILMVFGPHTNAANLLTKYPDAAGLLKGLIFQGGSPFGYKKTKPHISFNISSDPEAANIVFNSGIKKIIMIPSELGRRHAYVPYEHTMNYPNLGDVGKFVYEMYDQHWEPGFDDKRVATNDTCEIMCLLKPQYFKPMKGYITVDLEDSPGKTFIDFKSKTPNITVLMKANGRKINKYIDKKYASAKDLKLAD